MQGKTNKSKSIALIQFRRLRRLKNLFKKTDSTRGYGLIEYFLAIQRAKIANRLIPNKYKNGRVLDIGCGSYPIFLLTSRFMEKFGIDKIRHSNKVLLKRFNLFHYDIEDGNSFPFQDNYLDVITMLAVIEHLEYPNLVSVVSKIYRMLKPGGIFIITVPSCWSSSLLKIMSRLKLVSKVEIDDHKSYLKTSKFRQVFKEAGFNDVKSGYFELFFNRWFLVKKED